MHNSLVLLQISIPMWLIRSIESPTMFCQSLDPISLDPTMDLQLFVKLPAQLVFCPIRWIVKYPSDLRKIRKIKINFAVNWTKFKIQETENSSHFKINDRSFTSVLLNIKKGLHMIFSVFKFGATEPSQSSIDPTRFLVSQFHIFYLSTKFICLEYKAGSRFIS